MSTISFEEKKQTLIQDFEHNFPEISTFYKNYVQSSYDVNSNVTNIVISNESTGK